MIAKSNKFPTRIQFLAFRASAKQLTTPHLRILFEARPVPSGAKGEVGSRLSVVVPIKVNKRAITRNHFKRLVYDRLWPTIKEKNLDCIVILKPIALLKGKPSDTIILSELAGIHV